MCLYKKGILVYEESQFSLRKKLISYLLWIKLYHVLNQALWDHERRTNKEQLNIKIPTTRTFQSPPFLDDKK